MRLKSYYMPEEITNNLYTPGGQFQTDDGVEYKGSYHQYITNEIYTGGTWNAKYSKKLILLERITTKDSIYFKLKKQLKTKFNTPIPYKPIISPSDYKLGYIDRYFLKKRNEQKFIEIDESQYKSWERGTIDSNVYDALNFRWFISGNIQDIKLGDVVQYGIITKNTRQIQYAHQQLPGIQTSLKDPLQYYTDTDFVVPKDINE